jgi:hypothetical protein
MKNFKIEIMDGTNYNKMMCGYNGYCVEEIWVEAETKEQAYKIACEKYPEHHINTYIVSKEEIEEMKKAWNDRQAEEERKAKEKAEKKAKKEEEKAEEMGMTIEEYKEYKKAIANKKRYETEIKKQQEIIEKAKRAIKAQERKIKQMEKEIEKFENR